RLLNALDDEMKAAACFLQRAHRLVGARGDRIEISLREFLDVILAGLNHLQPAGVNLIERDLAVHGSFGELRNFRYAFSEHVDTLDRHERGVDVEKNEPILRRQALAPFRTICTRSAKRSR